MIDLEKLRKSNGRVLAIVDTKTGEYEPVSEELQVVRHGKWRKYYFEQTFLRCSECGYPTLIASNYCPDCGAKMDEVLKEWEVDRPLCMVAERKDE